MIETLAIEDPIKYRAAIAAGNSFVRNDAAFRAACGERPSGFSYIVVTSTDADADHEIFESQGLSGGDLVAFSRDFERPDGTLDTVSAKLAFATPPGHGTAFYFTCEDIIVPDVDRSDMLDHPNGAVGVSQVVSVAKDPVRYAEFLRAVIAPNQVRVREGAVTSEFPNGRISIVAPATLVHTFDREPSVDSTEIVHAGLIVDVADISATEAIFVRNKVPISLKRENMLIVDDGLGCFFAFRQ